MGCWPVSSFLLLAATRMSAQAPIIVSVVGTVFDSLTMRPIPGALIRLVRADDPAAGRSAVADLAGTFGVLDVHLPDHRRSCLPRRWFGRRGVRAGQPRAAGIQRRDHRVRCDRGVEPARDRQRARALAGSGTTAVAAMGDRTSS